MPKTAVAERPYLACEQAFGRAVNWGEGKATPFPFPSLFFSPKRTESLFTGLALLIDISLIIRTLHFPAYIAQSHFHCIIKTTFQIKK